MRWLAMAVLAAGVSGAYANHLPEPHWHGYFVPTQGEIGPPIDPPVEPPPVEPPPSGVEARERWEAACEGARRWPRHSGEDWAEEPDGRVLKHCTTWDSAADVWASSDILRNGQQTGVPNSPNYPLTNGKCPWRSNQNRCYPAFGSELNENGGPSAVSSPDEWTCEDRDELEQLHGFSMEPSEEATATLRASLRSPCYHREVPGALVGTDWADMGSSIQVAGLANWSPGLTSDKLYFEYEIAFDPTFFRAERRGSDTMKLIRIDRNKNSNCSDDRFADERVTRIRADWVEIGMARYCTPGGEYAPTEGRFRIMAEQARQWFRIARTFDYVGGTIETEVRDESGEIVFQFTEERTPRGPWRFREARYLNHSTSHQSCAPVDECDVYLSGHYAIRHFRFEFE